MIGHGPIRFIASGAESEVEVGERDKPNLMVRIISGAPKWIVVYQGSPDKQNWTTMITHDSKTNSSGETIFIGAERFPCIYRRVYCVSITGGGMIEALGWATK